jgi:O-antigen/teichoic acid export membrane protein
MFSDPLLTAVYPEISRLSATGEQKKIRGLLIMLTKILFLVCTTYFVGMYFFGGYILGILGKEYISALNVILVMIIGVSSAVIFFWARPMLLVHGKASKTIWATLISISLQFSLLYFLVPKYGELGAGIASASSYIVAVIVFLIFLTQKTIK